MKKNPFSCLNFGSPRSLSALGVMVILGLFSRHAHAQNDESLRKRFLSEAPAAWQEYSLMAEKLHGSVEYSQKEQGKVVDHMRFEFKDNTRCRYILSRDLLKGSERVELHNSDYHCVLTRKKTDQAWLILSQTMRKKGSDTKLKPWAMAQSLVGITGSDLPDLLKQENFRLVAARPVTREGSEMVEIDFTNFHPLIPGKSSGVIQSGSIILDPNHYWCRRWSNIQVKYIDPADGVAKDENELRDPSAKFPIPKLSLHTIVTKHTDITMTRIRRYEYDLREPPSLPPDSEFYISAFGLPEPMGITVPGPSRWYLWFMAIAAVSLALGWFLWRNLQQRKLAAAKHKMGNAI